MFGYEAFNALKSALVEFFHAEGNILPLNQANGLERLGDLLEPFRNEVDKTLLNHEEKRINLYLLNLEYRASALNSMFDDLFSGMMHLPEVQSIIDHTPLVDGDNRSDVDIHSAICSALFSDGIKLERLWTAGTMRIPNVGDSAAFFATLSPWQKLAMRYRYVQNVTLNIQNHLITARSFWTANDHTLKGTLATNSDGTEASQSPKSSKTKDLRLEWKLEIKMLAELLCLAENVEGLNLKELFELGQLPNATRRLCEGLVFRGTDSDKAARYLYEALRTIIKGGGLNPGKIPPRVKLEPLGALFINKHK